MLASQVPPAQSHAETLTEGKGLGLLSVVCLERVSGYIPVSLQGLFPSPQSPRPGGFKSGQEAASGMEDVP